MATVTVERASVLSQADVKALANLVTQLSSSARPLTREALDTLMAHEAVTLFVARTGGDVVGMLSLACFPTPTGLRAWIEDVVTSEVARGAGVGSALVTAALEEAKAQGARTVDLTSRPTREAANRLYQRIGFQRRESNLYRYTLM